MSAFAELQQVLQRYFDGLHHSDADLLAGVFHPQAHYFCATDGTLVHLDMQAYLPLVAARASPASQGHTRTDRIVAIEFAGPETAFAKVECSIPPKHFIDFLSLVRLDGRWQVVAKVFHYSLPGSTTSSNQ